MQLIFYTDNCAKEFSTKDNDIYPYPPDKCP